MKKISDAKTLVWYTLPVAEPPCSVTNGRVLTRVGQNVFFFTKKRLKRFKRLKHV